jgi:hypothetical protein
MKTFIKNRDGNEICVLVENINDNDKLVFAMHGLSSYKEQQHFRTIVEAFLRKRLHGSDLRCCTYFW